MWEVGESCLGFILIEAIDECGGAVTAETVVISMDAREMRDDDYSMITNADFAHVCLCIYPCMLRFQTFQKTNTHRPTVFDRDLSTHRCRSDTPPG